MITELPIPANASASGWVIERRYSAWRYNTFGGWYKWETVVIDDKSYEFDNELEASPEFDAAVAYCDRKYSEAVEAAEASLKHDRPGTKKKPTKTPGPMQLRLVDRASDSIVRHVELSMPPVGKPGQRLPFVTIELKNKIIVKKYVDPVKNRPGGGPIATVEQTIEAGTRFNAVIIESGDAFLVLPRHSSLDEIIPSNQVYFQIDCSFAQILEADPAFAPPDEPTGPDEDRDEEEDDEDEEEDDDDED